MSVPLYDFCKTNERLTDIGAEVYYSCCGKYICKGCVYSLVESGTEETCPFCKAKTMDKTYEETFEEYNMRAQANDAGAMCVLGADYYHGWFGLQQDRARAMKLWKRAAEIGSSQAHFFLGTDYYEGGDLKKAKFHYEAGAMAGNEVARFNIGCIEKRTGDMERAVKHWIIAASAGDYNAMHQLRKFFEKGVVSRESIDTTLAAYNTSCAEMRSEARDNVIQFEMERE